MELGDKVSPVSRPRGLRPSARIEASWMGTERSPDSTEGIGSSQRAEKATSHTAAMNGLGKSDESVVSKKPANEDLPLWAWAKEQAERRDSTKRNPGEDGTSRTQCRNHGVSPVLAWVREKARQDKKVKFTSLYHHLDPVRLRQRHRLTWERMRRFATLWLPRPHICHPWPLNRFLATTQR